MNRQGFHVQWKAIYASINHLDVIYIKFKREIIKEELVFPRCEAVVE